MRHLEQPGLHTTPTSKEHREINLLDQLWRKYRFPGPAPRTDTVVAQRLLETCLRYDRMINARLAERPASNDDDGDPENYHPAGSRPSYTVQKAKISDQAQRELHNQIAIMIFGQSRDTMKEHLAMQISNFASEFANLNSLEQPETENSPDTLAA